jgi:hypothetical protein
MSPTLEFERLLADLTNARPGKAQSQMLHHGELVEELAADEERWLALAERAEELARGF